MSYTEEVYLSVNQAAARYGVSHKTIRAAIRKGQMKCVRLGRAIRISQAALPEAFPEQARNVPAAGPRKPAAKAPAGTPSRYVFFPPPSTAKNASS
jgi:excisionase family DNA binding protein